jgi:hypothetical protein
MEICKGEVPRFLEEERGAVACHLYDPVYAKESEGALVS